MTPATLDERLARLAPTSAPDHARLSAARVTVVSRLADPAAPAVEWARQRRRPPVLRLVSAATAVAGLTVALLLWPSPSSQTSAFATWVPTPAPVTPGDAVYQ